MGVLCHSAAFISVQEDVVNVEGSSDQRLVVSDGGRDWASNRVLGTGVVLPRLVLAVQCGDSPQALINRTNIKVNLQVRSFSTTQSSKYL